MIPVAITMLLPSNLGLLESEFIRKFVLKWNSYAPKLLGRAGGLCPSTENVCGRQRVRDKHVRKEVGCWLLVARGGGGTGCVS